MESSIQVYNQFYEQMFEGHPVKIYGSEERPLFVANDIAYILDIKCIRSTTRDFNDNEIRRCVPIVHTGSNSGYATVNMLTERGLIKLMYITRGRDVEKFHEFVYQLLHGLRTRKLELLVINYESKIKALQDQINNNRTKQKQYVYVIQCQANGCGCFYIGSAKNVEDRFKEHIQNWDAKDSFVPHMKKHGCDSMKLIDTFEHDIMDESEIKQYEQRKQDEYREIYGDDKIINKNKAYLVDESFCTICSKQLCNKYSYAKHLESIAHKRKVNEMTTP
jgi:predicted GIY-YIG superfamily endonuclease/prophage antirepressor-like protein